MAHTPLPTKQLSEGSSPTDLSEFYKLPVYNTMSFVAFVLAVGSVFFFYLTTPLAIIFGHIGLHQLKGRRSGERGKWMAVSALVISYINLLLIAFVYFAPALFGWKSLL